MGFRQRRFYSWIFLLAGVIAIRVLSVRKDWVETVYSAGIYPPLSRAFRTIFGWLPFSLGDILYTTAGGWALYEIFRVLRGLRNNGFSLGRFLQALARYLFIVICIYLAFNLFWGLNYNRRGIAWQLGLKTPPDTNSANLGTITQILLEKTNRFRVHPVLSPDVPSSPVLPNVRPGFSSSRRVALIAYDSLGRQYPFLSYTPTSFKPSLFGVVGNYMGYSGYYNPFSGEAQVNTHVPTFLLPFSSCHEIAHQLGYAKENEANFVGFLAARLSGDSSMLYSLYLNMFLYANGELRGWDSVQARKNYLALDTGVKADLAEYRRFLDKYRSPVERLTTAFYEQYLKWNEQPAGHRTYNKVVLWLMAYYDKYGEL